MAKAKYKQRKDGRYYTKVWDGSYNEDGSKHRVALYSSKSSGDLEKKVNKLKHEVQQRQHVIQTQDLFYDYALQWRKVYKANRADNTQDMYDNIIDNHLIALDGVKINDIRKIHLQYGINNAVDHPRTCQQICMVFKQIVKSAVQDKYLPSDACQDICIGIDMPRYTPSEKRALYPEEKEAIEKADLTDRERAFIYIIHGCGTRRGETLALTKFDFVFSDSKNEIVINKAIAFTKKGVTLKTTKTTNGIRRVPIPGIYIPFLKSYTAGLAEANLFTKLDGSQITHSSYVKMWDSIVKKLNIAAGGTSDLKVIMGLTAHVFRHNYCTELCYQIPKISIPKIARLMGDTEKMVLEVYSHIMEEREDAQGVVDDVFSAVKSEYILNTLGS